MDKVTKYQDILHKTLERYAAIKPVNAPTLEQQVIVDRERNHFQLLSVGHRENLEFVLHIIFHFDIIDGKVWIQCNNTDALIADELMEAGVDRADIVLGFVPARFRESAIGVTV